MSLSSKKLHQNADGHAGGVAAEFSRTPGKKLDGNRNAKNAVVSLEDDFVSSLESIYCALFILLQSGFSRELCSHVFH